VILGIAALGTIGCAIIAILGGQISPGESRRADVAATKGAMPTETPRPIAPRFAEIRANVQSMTEAQWKKYLDELAGYRVYKWRGWVVEVDKELSGNYEVWIDMDSPEELFSVQDVYFDVPENIALQLAKGQQVTFSGTIKRVSELLGSVSVHLVDAKFE